jgi:hypothetical protein
VKVPETLFVFIDESLPAAVHNLRFTGQMASRAAMGWGDPDFVNRYQRNEIDWLPFISNPNTTPWLSFHSARLISSYAVEWGAEVSRRLHYPEKPSRLSALYAFGDLDSCARAARLHRWSIETVRAFRVVKHPLTRVAKVNMEIVSAARRAYVVSSLDEQAQDKLWRAYWSGSGDVQMDLPAAEPGHRVTVNSGVIWEYLIDGMLQLVDP